MSVAENLQVLRKRKGITQEQLADELGVSRQAISKWETGEAFPEMDKLIALCDKFGVSCDTLLRGTVAESDTPDCEGERKEKRRIDRFSLMMAFGVGLVLFGVAICTLLCGFGALYERDLYSVFGGVCVFLCVACSVFLFVYGGITNENYKKAHPERQGVPAEVTQIFAQVSPRYGGADFGDSGARRNSGSRICVVCKRRDERKRFYRLHRNGGVFRGAFVLRGRTVSDGDSPRGLYGGGNAEKRGTGESVAAGIGRDLRRDHAYGNGDVSAVRIPRRTVASRLGRLSRRRNSLRDRKHGIAELR